MCPVGMGTFHQHKFMGYSFDYFSMIRSLEMKEWYPLILVWILRQVITGLHHAIFRNDSVSGLYGKGGAIALARPRTRYIKNTRAVCRTPKPWYGVLSQLFLIHSFSTLLITLFLISLVKSLHSTLHLLFFVHIVTFSFPCSFHLLNTLAHS